MNNEKEPTTHSDFNETLKLDNKAKTLAKVLGTRGKIFFTVIDEMDPQTNIAHIEQRNLADRVNASRPYISRILKEFEANKLLFTGRGKIYVNPRLIYRGNEDDKMERILEFSDRYYEKQMNKAG